MLCTILEELGHTQAATLETNIANTTVKQLRSKAIDMHFYWREWGQGELYYFGEPAVITMLAISPIIVLDSCKVVTYLKNLHVIISVCSEDVLADVTEHQRHPLQHHLTHYQQIEIWLSP
jgi:hypothetical protein